MQVFGTQDAITSLKAHNRINIEINLVEIMRLKKGSQLYKLPWLIQLQANTQFKGTRLLSSAMVSGSPADTCSLNTPNC